MNAEAMGRRTPAVILWGALAVLAWALFAALFSGGQAHADEGDDPKPLTGLTNLVSGVVSKVVDPVAESTADTVTQVTAPVVDTAKKVVEKTADTVATVPVVGKPAADAVDAVDAARKTVTAVTNTVTTVATNAPVSSIVRPVTEVVRKVPVVGDALDELGAVELLDTSADAVDDVVGTVTPVVEDTVTPVIDALEPQPQPADVDAETSTDTDAAAPVVTPALESPEALAPASPGSDISAIAVLPRGASFATALQPSAAEPESSVSSAAVPANGPMGPAAGPPLTLTPATSSAGPGGSSSGMNAALHHLSAQAREAGALTRAPEDSVLPPSPVGRTDVSPG